WPVDAVRKRVFAFARRGGRVCASTGPAVSIGLFTGAPARRPATGACRTAAPRVIHARPGARTVSGADAWRGDGRFGNRRRNLAPPHQATSIANLDRACPRFPHQDRTLGRRLLTLPD